MRCLLSHGTITTTCVSLSHFQFLPLTSQHCVHQRWNPFVWRCHSWFNDCRSISPILHNLRIWCFHCNSNQKKKLLQSTPHLSILTFNNRNVWVFTQKVQCVFTQVCQYYLELKSAKGPSHFYLGYFSLSKKFNYVEKDTITLHLKLSNNDRPSYFPTSTPLGHPPSPQLITHPPLP